MGAGAIGCSIAYHLARRGITSQIIDREGIASRASGKAWAVWEYPPATCLAPDLDVTVSVWTKLDDAELQSEIAQRQEYAQRMVDLHWISYHRLPEAIRELEERGGIDVGYRELPFVQIALSAEEKERYSEDFSAVRSAGYYEGDWLEPDELQAIFPNINPQVKGGCVFPVSKLNLTNIPCVWRKPLRKWDVLSAVVR